MSRRHHSGTFAMPLVAVQSLISVTGIWLLLFPLGLGLSNASLALDIADLLGPWRHDGSEAIIELRQTESGQVDGYFRDLPVSLREIGFDIDDKPLSNVQLHGKELSFTVAIRSEDPAARDLCAPHEVPVKGRLGTEGQRFQGTIKAGEYVIFRNDTNEPVRCLYFPSDREDPYILNRVDPPIKLVTVGARPYPTEKGRFQLNDIQPIQVQVTYDQPPTTHDNKLTVRWGDEHRELSLNPTANPTVFTSDWHYLTSTTMHDYQELESLLESNSDRDYALTKELFAGSWQVSQTGGDLGDAFGMAQVADDGKYIDLFLTSNHQEKHYRSFEVQATKDLDGHRHTLSARFQEISSSAPLSLLEGQDKWPLGQSLVIPDATEVLSFEAGNHRVEARVAFHTSPPDRIRFLLMGRSSGRLAGAWSEELANGDLRIGGQHTWVKDARIDGIEYSADQDRPAHNGQAQVKLRVSEPSNSPFSMGARSASASWTPIASSPVKQWNTPRAAPSSSRSRNVSSVASRVWMMTGRPSAQAAVARTSGSGSRSIASARAPVAAGFRVEEAHNGLQALERAQHRHPDIVVADLHIPGIDGFELTRRLRASPIRRA